MLERTVDVIYGLTGQTVECYPPEWAEGVPSTASCSVYAGDVSLDDDAEFSPTVTVDSVNTVVKSASGYSQSNPKRLNVSDTTSVTVGRFYRVANAYGQVELVKVAAISTNTYVDCEDDLAYDYATSDTFKGVRMSFTVDATWVATEENLLGARSSGDTADMTFADMGLDAAEGGTARIPSYKAVFAYTVNSITRRHYLYLRLVRQAAKHGVTYKDLLPYLPEVLNDEYKDRRGRQCRDVIDAAWAEVRADILQAGHRPEQFRDTEQVNGLVLWKTIELYGASGLQPNGWTPELFTQRASQEYQRRFAAAVDGLAADVDQGTSGGVTGTPTRMLTFRS